MSVNRLLCATSSTPCAAAIYSGHVSTVGYHAGNISWRTGKKLRLDATTETFDDAEANQYLGREHRKGFELPKIAWSAAAQRQH